MNKQFRIIAVLGTVALIAAGCNSKTAPNNTSDGGQPGVSTGTTINLSNQGLTSIPAYVFNQTNTQELNVSHNLLTGAIQAEIRHLARLKVLNASYNSMTGVPAEIGQLRDLEVLDLSHNQLTGLPQELGNLQQLKILNLAGNNYSKQDLDYIRSKLPASVNIIVN